MPTMTPLAEEYLAGARAQVELLDGVRLREAAHDVLEQLPAGPLVLLSASDAGIGIAAACAALRDESTAWSPVTLTHHQELPMPGRVVFVEATPPDAGWLDAVHRRFPEALIAVPRRSAAPAATLSAVEEVRAAA